MKTEYKAPFLWPHEQNSIEEAGYEFANARTERYRKIWWRILLSRTQTMRLTPKPKRR